MSSMDGTDAVNHRTGPDVHPTPVVVMSATTPRAPRRDRARRRARGGVAKPRGAWIQGGALAARSPQIGRAQVARRIAAARSAIGSARPFGLPPSRGSGLRRRESLVCAAPRPAAALLALIRAARDCWRGDGVSKPVYTRPSRACSGSARHHGARAAAAIARRACEVCHGSNTRWGARKVTARPRSPSEDSPSADIA